MKNIFIGNLNFSTSEGALRQLFAAFGPAGFNNVYCIDDPRLKVRMASERQEKDKYTHAEVRFEHPARGKDTCDECAHFIRGSLGGWHVGGCEIVKDPIEPEDWCKKFNASLVKPLKTLKLTSRLTTMAAWIPTDFLCIWAQRRTTRKFRLGW